MAWKAHEHRWPNGRRYWTVEDRQSKPARMRIGKGGGVTKFHDYHMALCEVSRLVTEEKPKPKEVFSLPTPRKGWDVIDYDDRF